MKEMARVYRRAISTGLRLYVNNRLVEAFDPTYSMPNARHTKFLDGPAKQSRLIHSKPVPIPVSEGSSQMVPAIIKIYKLPRLKNGHSYLARHRRTICDLPQSAFGLHQQLARFGFSNRAAGFAQQPQRPDCLGTDGAQFGLECVSPGHHTGRCRGTRSARQTAMAATS